jgi:hypothetical protein
MGIGDLKARKFHSFKGFQSVLAINYARDAGHVGLIDSKVVSHYNHDHAVAEMHARYDGLLVMLVMVPNMLLTYTFKLDC